MFNPIWDEYCTYFWGFLGWVEPMFKPIKRTLLSRNMEIHPWQPTRVSWHWSRCPTQQCCGRRKHSAGWLGRKRRKSPSIFCGESRRSMQQHHC